MSRLSVFLLGPFRAAIDGQPVTGFRSDKVRALMAYLAVELDRPHRRESLAGLLWPDYPERSARAHLRVALTNLRQVIGDHQARPPFLLISRQTIQFHQGSDAWVDATAFRTLLQSSQPTTEQMVEAVDLYRGEFLAGFSLADSPPFEEWALLTREQFHRLVIETLDHLANSLEQRGECERALVHAWRQVDLDPWREKAHRQVMRLLAQTGQRSAALAQYRHCRRVLREELGVDVSEETRQLYEKLKRGKGLPGASARRPRHNLPAQTTSFEGREEELAEIDQLLSNPSCRLLTLVGPGGIGKTRLALEAAAQKIRNYKDGVYFVPLARLSSAQFVVSGIASALSFTPDKDASNLDTKTQLLEYLGERTVLLLMDSFEHLIQGCHLLPDILEHAPNVRLLVTSREQLGLRGEWVKELQGMRYPDIGDQVSIEAYDALKLFATRARQSDSGFTLSADELPHVNHICRLVEGMPLGIELAAAWVSVLSCREIAREIEQSIDILAAPARELPDRHRSLRAAFDHSWKLLTEEARSGFRKLSVFRGGFSREAAMAVAEVDLALLGELVHKSLLRRNAQGRYEIHELLRQYAAEKLDALPEERRNVRERHSRYYVEFLSAREPDLFGERLPEIRDEIRTEMENVRAGVHWAVAHWSEGEAREALARFDAVFLAQGWYEGKEAFAAIVQALQEGQETEPDGGMPSPPVLSAMAYQALYGSLLGDSDASEAILQKCLPALELLGIQREVVVSHFAHGVSAFYRGEFEEARQQFEESLALARAGQFERWVAHSLMWLGWLLCELGDYELAQTLCEDSYSHYREQGNRWGMGFVLTKLGFVADAKQDHSLARRCHEEALDILTAFGDRAGQAYATSRLSLTAYGEGQYAEARQLGRQGYELFEKLGHRWGMGASLCRTGFAALGLGRCREARTCFHQALELAVDMKHIPLMLYALSGFASLLAEAGEEPEALELFAFVEEHPQTPVTYLNLVRQRSLELETRVSQEALSAARAKGRTSELEAVVEAVLRDPWGRDRFPTLGPDPYESNHGQDHTDQLPPCGITG
jgi:predicted ATPase/DNA-binding SARP family transcriptional activator